MTTGRINQVARKVGTHATPEGDTRAQTLGQAQRETAHATRSLSPRILSSSRTDRQCIFRAARTQRHEQHRQPSCRHRPNEFGGDLRRDDRHTSGAPIGTRLCETSCNTDQTTDHSKVQSARAAQQASTRKSQCSVHKPHSRPTANDTQARSNATNVDATKTWRTNREGAAPLTPAVQPPDPTQHRS